MRIGVAKGWSFSYSGITLPCGLKIILLGHAGFIILQREQALSASSRHPLSRYQTVPQMGGRGQSVRAPDDSDIASVIPKCRMFLRSACTATQIGTRTAR